MKNLISAKARILKSDGSNISKLFKHQINRGIHSRAKKTHYQCWICGKIEAPYFKEGELCAPITDGYRWHKIDKNRWICHHCDAHGFSDSNTTVPREQREPIWDEWQEYVRTSNKKVLSLIKEKDPEYYEEYELYESEDEDDE